MKAMQKMKHKEKDVNKATRLKKTQPNKSIEIDEAQTKTTTRHQPKRQKGHKRPNKIKDKKTLQTKDKYSDHDCFVAQL